MKLKWLLLKMLFRTCRMMSIFGNLQIIELSRILSRCQMWLSTKFVGCKSRSQSIHYQWLRVISCTFKCRLLLCSAKHLHVLICRDVTATTDIHVHFFGVTFTVTASSQEQQREVRVSATHVRWLPRGTSVHKTVYLQHVSYRFCPAWIFIAPLMA